MQCLDDQLEYPPMNSTTNTWTGWEVVNKVADTSNAQRRHSAKGKAMSHQSATLSRQSPRCWTTALLFTLFLLAVASVKSAALHQKPSLSAPKSVDSFASPLQPVLALNSSAAVNHTIEDVHNILAPLTDEADLDAFAETEGEEANQSSRSKREAPFDQSTYAGNSLTKPPKNRNKKFCYTKALRRCGRTFVNSYKFVRVKNNKDSDILVAQCALRTAFFDCLKARANECNKEKPSSNETIAGKAKGGKRSQRADSDEAPAINNKKEKVDKRLRKTLAETIWDSRVCIFKNSLKITPGPL